MAVTEKGFRPRGRPRGETTPAERTDQWRQQLHAKGGHELSVKLGPFAWQALQAMSQKGDFGPFVDRLIQAEYQRRGGSAVPVPGEVLSAPSD